MYRNLKCFELLHAIGNITLKLKILNSVTLKYRCNLSLSFDDFSIY